jgi:hypothetical protein
MEILTAIIDDLEVIVVEEVACYGIFHNVDVSFPLWWHDVRFVDLDSSVYFAKECSERFYPSSFEVG